MFSQRFIAVGVTGGIAVYKTASLISLLKKQGAQVQVIMTRNAMEFMTPLTFEVLSGNPVVTDTFDRTAPWEVEHVAIAKKADLFIVAPATANFIGKAASGIADDMLLTTILAARCPVVVAPAMNTYMYRNPAVQENMETLKNRGFHIMDTGEGALACGDTGEGRMRESAEILEYAAEVFRQGYDMAGLRVLVTAGPTREKLDPVRFITSPSSGKMGYAVAENALRRGAQVTLISGPVALKPPAKAQLIPVETAQQMFEECMARYADADIVVKTAAVADYRPKQTAEHKIKKGGELTVELERTPDILKEMGRLKGHQILVGFAAETRDVEAYALAKLSEKNLDMVAANDVCEAGAGFGCDTNHIVLYKRDGGRLDLGTPLQRRNGPKDFGRGACPLPWPEVIF